MLKTSFMQMSCLISLPVLASAISPGHDLALAAPPESGSGVSTSQNKGADAGDPQSVNEQATGVTGRMGAATLWVPGIGEPGTMASLRDHHRLISFGGT